MSVWLAAALIIAFPFIVSAAFLVLDRKWRGKWWWD